MIRNVASAEVERNTHTKRLLKSFSNNVFIVSIFFLLWFLPATLIYVYNRFVRPTTTLVACTSKPWTMGPIKQTQTICKRVDEVSLRSASVWLPFQMWCDRFIRNTHRIRFFYLFIIDLPSISKSSEIVQNYLFFNCDDIARCFAYAKNPVFNYNCGGAKNQMDINKTSATRNIFKPKDRITNPNNTRAAKNILKIRNIACTVPLALRSVFLLKKKINWNMATAPPNNYNKSGCEYVIFFNMCEATSEVCEKPNSTA